MNSETLFSPAKINLFLAVTGRRQDGFHDLISLVSPVGFGDEIDLERIVGKEISLECDRSELPTDERNLVSRALILLQEKTGDRAGWRVSLRKRIPIGGGLGGGSSNAAIVLLAANKQLDNQLSDSQLRALAAEIGSDCPFFLEASSCVMRGRGEMIAKVGESAQKRLQGRKVALFWPPFPISTAWAYSCFENRPESFSSALKAEEILNEWLSGDQLVEGLVANDFEAALSLKYPTFAILLNHARNDLGVSCAVSGSGSSCFAFPQDQSMFDELEKMIRSIWGEEAGFERATLL